MAEPPPVANQWEDVTWSAATPRYVAVGSTGTNRTMVGIVPTVPTVPLQLIAELQNSQAKLTWSTPAFDGNEPITGYRIERSASGGSFETLIVNTNSISTTYIDTTVIAGMTYAYRVFALNTQGQSAASNEASIELSAVPTPQPQDGDSGEEAALANTGASQYGLIAGALMIFVVGCVLRKVSRTFA